MKTPFSLRLALFILLPSAFIVFAQGPLTPPGAPAPMMKTLQQVEPRIDVRNAPASAVTTTNGSYQFIINQPGSYYLSANLGVTKPNGIQINAEGVTLDLKGFRISRASGTGGSGIEIVATAHGASVRDGSITGFANGILSLGVGVDYVRGCAFRDLAVGGCTTYGIFAGRGAVLDSCRAHDNTGTDGIHAESGSTLSNCVANNNNLTNAGIFAGSASTLSNCIAFGNTAVIGIITGSSTTLTGCVAVSNTGGYGILAQNGSTLSNCTADSNRVLYGLTAGSGSTLTNCAALSNTSDNVFSSGIWIQPGGTVTACVSSGNTSTAATLTSSTGAGFLVNAGSTIQNCTATGNKGSGIYVQSTDCVVRDNHCDGNGSGTGDGAGIHATSTDTRIEGNNVSDNDRGIDVDAAGNIIVRNTCSGNANNWDVVAGNVILVVNATTAALVTGNSGGTAPGSTDPNANFTY